MTLFPGGTNSESNVLSIPTVIVGMKQMFAFAVLMLVVYTCNTSCKKGGITAPANNATIIGGDPRAGMCEGGTFILIDGHPNPNFPSTGYYDIGLLPPSFHLDNSTKYPIKVKITYQVDSKCLGNFVDISTITLAQ